MEVSLERDTEQPKSVKVLLFAFCNGYRAFSTAYDQSGSNTVSITLYTQRNRKDYVPLTFYDPSIRMDAPCGNCSYMVSV